MKNKFFYAKFFCIAILLCVLTAISITAASGDLDLSFGNGGKVITPDIGAINDMAIQPDGKIVAGGGSANTRLYSVSTTNIITVTNTNDSGAGSLRQAIADAAPGDTINFNVTGTITLTSGQLVINKHLTIRGPGASLLSISGNGTSRVFQINGGIPATLDGLTIRNGSDVGISTGGTLTVKNSLITQNGGSGINTVNSLLTVINSTISNNTHSGINADAGCYFPSYLSLNNSTISGNGGTGINNFDGIADIANSTIVSNRGGIFLAEDCWSGGGTTRLWNTIVAGNTLSPEHPYGRGTDIFGRNIAVAGHNLIGDTAYAGGIMNGVNGNIVGVDPLLEPLQNNGGPTFTHALRPASPAINAGNNCVLTTNGCGNDHPALPTDQRGLPRNGTVDIGAFERQPDDLFINAPYDFDGDGKADVSVFRPSDKTWYLNQSTNGFSATQFGLSTDRITPADYDGDGKTDISVYRDGIWYWISSSTQSVGIVEFGLADDIPVPTDFTGDGRAELAVYRNGTWWMLNLANNQVGVIQFGLASDKPVPADYDGDGRADQAVYRNGEWHLNRSTQGYGVVYWGLATDKPVPADYDGDGKTDPAVYRDGTWYLLQSLHGWAELNWGIASDIPAPADYDGDGRADAAIYRNGNWWILQSTNGVAVQQFGLGGDKPVPAAYLP